MLQINFDVEKQLIKRGKPTPKQNKPAKSTQQPTPCTQQIKRAG